MKIAVVGSGISGLVAAYLLRDAHEVTVYEAGDYVGGHTHTVNVATQGESHAVDTGFIVYNDRNYPNFTRLLQRLKVETQPSDMSFSAANERTGLEYRCSSLNTLFAQRRNLLKPRFYRMFYDVFRFNRQSRELLNPGVNGIGLRDYLQKNRYSTQFIDDFLMPMGAAIWSADPAQMNAFPAHFFARFFHHHGFLNVRDQPQWRVVSGGSQRYVDRITAGFEDQFRTNTPVRQVIRRSDQVEIVTDATKADCYDHVVIATHSDQALRMLTDATPEECEALAAVPYQENETILHTDASILPRSERAWASWNARLPAEPCGRVTMTYHMNRLQSLRSRRQFCVTLNESPRIDSAQVLRRLVYHHPVFTSRALSARHLRDRINGPRRTWFCGAYWGYGFHEDGVNSALEVCRHFGKGLAA